jgi:hypothetical protein
MFGWPEHPAHLAHNYIKISGNSTIVHQRQSAPMATRDFAVLTHARHMKRGGPACSGTLRIPTASFTLHCDPERATSYSYWSPSTIFSHRRGVLLLPISVPSRHDEIDSRGTDAGRNEAMPPTSAMEHTARTEPNGANALNPIEIASLLRGVPALWRDSADEPSVLNSRSSVWHF